MSSNEPVKNGCEVIHEMFPILNSQMTRLFQVSIRKCLNCVHNCDDHSLLDFKSAVQYMKHFMYHRFTKGTLLSRMQKVRHCCRQVPPLLQTEAAVYTL